MRSMLDTQVEDAELRSVLAREELEAERTEARKQWSMEVEPVYPARVSSFGCPLPNTFVDSSRAPDCAGTRNVHCKSTSASSTLSV